jgi:thiol-disulfide isomerase/thioredoxin
MRPILFALVFHVAALGALAQTPAEAPPAPKAADAEESAAPKRPAAKAEPAKVVPEEVFAAELKDLYDFSFTLGEYRGRVFVLNFWASWCGPCRAEIPELNKLREEFAPRGVEFVGLTVESPGSESEKVREFAREHSMDYKVGWADPDVALALMSKRAVPQTLVVAADGRIVERFVGYSTYIPNMLRQSIEKALAPPPAEKEGAEPEPGATPAPTPPAPETSRPPGA